MLKLNDGEAVTVSGFHGVESLGMRALAEDLLRKTKPAHA